MISVQTSPATLDRFGHYQLRGSLGEGGFGRVYEAWDPTLRRTVALKCLKAAHHHAAPDALIDEARRAASLRHRAFVKIYAFEECDDAQAIVMELVPGATLRSSIGRQTPDAAQALDIIDLVAEAMAEAHRVGLIHGDIKPTNLMLEPSGAVRILDFGLARKVDPLATDLTAAHDGAATVAYTAPERLMGCPLSRGSDIYSLGVVLYEFLTGERPFATLNGLALAAAHVHTTSDSWPFPASTDRSLVELVRKMTAHDPAQRLASMEAVRERVAALRAALGNDATTHAPAQAETTPMPESRSKAISTSVTTPPTFVQRWRWPLFATAAAGAAVATLLTLPTVPLVHWLDKLAPYSESQAMAVGMEKLGMADRDGALEQAVQSFNSILERNPRHAAAAAGASIAYSMRYLGDGRDENWRRFAEAGAQAALNEDDHLALAHAAQAWALTLKGDRSAALAAADRALALDPLDMSALNAKLVLLLELRRFDQLAALLDVCKSKWPRERMCHDIEGTMYHRRGDDARAEQAFRRSVQLEPEGIRAYSNLSAALLRRDRLDEALHVLQQGLRVHPSGALYTNLGNVLFTRGDYPGAARAFEQAASGARGSPNDYLKWANLADTLNWIPGRGEDAQRAYHKAIRLLAPRLERDPTNEAYLSRMGLYAAHVKDDAALGWIARAVLRAGDSPDVRFRAAVASELAGRRDLALSHLAIATKLGYPIKLIESEPNLIALRRDPRYSNSIEENVR
ncbi:serine/threonine protein kinase [Duganella sp. CF517]|uniref:serine/threonine-protein kinase n=1 Tax=Duganella sp. CF517 TaxID=1881038 RepID=UPI0008CB157F|nr:serine/threonine-protein kinase [Duganella sp. CF517]SEN77150.1 serine/threonine protein kinase [Duganella sp. CF517]